MGLTSIVMGILASEGPGIAADNATSAAGGVIKRQHNEHELRKKVDSIINEYCQGIQETMELEQEFDVEGLQKGSKELINSAKECTVGTEREIKQIQYFAKGYSLACVDSKKKNRSLDAILASVLNVVLEESGQAVTIKAVDEIHKHLDKLATHEDIAKLATHEDIKKIRDRLDTLSPNKPAEQKCKDFNLYYDYVKRIFTRKQDEEYAKLVGAYSDDEAYIDAFIDTRHDKMSALSFLEEWFGKGSSGTLLIYGEPGHGKSMLCNKAMFEYYKGTFLPKAKNVLSFTLNTGINDKIIKDGTVNLDAILSWDNLSFTFEDCRGALLFLDGFDEFIDAAQKTNITDIFSFIKKIEYKADVYDIHIVVLSRTIAISDALEERSAIRNKCYELIPITDKQQDDWLDDHSEYNDYKETLSALRSNTDMSKLLGIPFLFRMIVHTRYDGVSKNTVELYDNLINHLMEKRGFDRKDSKQSVIAELCDLAYDIYCNDTDTAIIDGDKRDDRWMIVFYIKQAENRIYGFFHKSFYQYFLAKYAYLHILDIKSDKQAEDIIGAFAERELDDTVRQYLSLMLNEDKRETIHKNLKLVIEALVRTEAYLNLESRYPDGTAEKTKLGRTINIYRNTLHLCAAFSYFIDKPFTDGIDVMIRTYPSSSIRICSDENNRADLSGTYLSGAKLSEAKLCGADLSRANLRLAELCLSDLRDVKLGGADLGRSDLSGAKMIGASMIEADLRGADLKGADLRSTDLSRAALCYANLSGAGLNEANLIGADLRGADLNGADLRSSDMIGANLTEVNLCYADLSGANLSEGDLGEADLRKSNLIGANLSRAFLCGANLSESNLEKANLSGANLSGANLSGSDLRVNSIAYAFIDLNKKELFDPSIEGYETVKWV